MAGTNASLKSNGNGRFQLHGELDFATATELWRESKILFAHNAPVQIDLAGVTRSNSAGVALLVEWLRQAKARQQVLQFINLPAQMNAIIQVADLETLLPVLSDNHADQ